MNLFLCMCVLGWVVQNLSYLQNGGRARKKMGTSDLIQHDFIKLYLVANGQSTSKSGNVDQ